MWILATSYNRQRPVLVNWAKGQHSSSTFGPRKDMQAYDVIILGTGGVGSAAAYHLARRGAKVLGIDRFAAGHDRGSSHGETRIIRQAYFEHPDYVPLLLRAYALWRDLEEECGVDLLHQVGLLQIGPPAGAVVRG